MQNPTGINPKVMQVLRALLTQERELQVLFEAPEVFGAVLQPVHEPWIMLAWAFTG